MSDFSSVEKLLRESGKAGQIMDAVSGEDTKRLERMIDKEQLNTALEKGDVKSLETILRQVLNTGAGKALARQLSGIMGK